MTGSSGYTSYPVYAGPRNYKEMNWENNDFFINVSSGAVQYYAGSQHTTLAAFNNGVGNQTNISVDPKFTDLSKGNIVPTNPIIANYGQPGYASSGSSYDNKNSLWSRFRCF